MQCWWDALCFWLPALQEVALSQPSALLLLFHLVLENLWIVP
jgi:hypothetical protein